MRTGAHGRCLIHTSCFWCYRFYGFARVRIYCSTEGQGKCVHEAATAVIAMTMTCSCVYYQQDLRWAIVGRNTKKLEDVKARLVSYDAECEVST